MFRLTTLLALAVMHAAGAAVPWNVKGLYQPPKWESVQEPKEPGVQAIYYEGLPWKGKRTKVFAWYGLPEKRSGKVAAMVLVHGGGGTAFAEWVRMWNKRGFAAIAMDTCGNVPETAEPQKPWAPKRTRHQWAGPEGWGDFANAHLPPEDQWPYHAVADVILAHSLIRSFPEIDTRRIGLTGISWGGYLTTIASSLDHRFAFAAPVYGCGFLGEDSGWLTIFEKLGREKASRWLSLWDPSNYLPLNKTPLLWVSGTNDRAYPLGSLQKSYRLPRGPRTLAIRVAMPHNHPDGARPEEIFAMAEAMRGTGAPLARITAQGLKNGELWAAYKSKVPVTKAELNCTRDSGPWLPRKWETTPARLDAKNKRASAPFPAEAKACYLNLIDSRGLLVSGEHVTR